MNKRTVYGLSNNFDSDSLQNMSRDETFEHNTGTCGNVKKLNTVTTLLQPLMSSSPEAEQPVILEPEELV
ncbi:unnamed protein product, partial [Tenebrio molitor]